VILTEEEHRINRTLLELFVPPIANCVMEQLVDAALRRSSRFDPKERTSSHLLTIQNVVVDVVTVNNDHAREDVEVAARELLAELVALQWYVSCICVL